MTNASAAAAASSRGLVNSRAAAPQSQLARALSLSALARALRSEEAPHPPPFIERATLSGNVLPRVKPRSINH